MYRSDGTGRGAGWWKGKLMSLGRTLLANCVPAMDLFATNKAPGVRIVGIGRSLKRPTLSFVGPHAVRTVNAHIADKAFISVKEMTPEGYVTDPDSLEAEVKRAMIERSEESVLLVDGSKFKQRGLHTIGHVSDFALVLAADTPTVRLTELAEIEAEVRCS